MHDLHEANKILNTILAYAQKNKLSKITKAEIELGEMMEHNELIKPENLKFNINLLAKNTIAENLTLDIKSIKGNNWVIKSIEGE